MKNKKLSRLKNKIWFSLWGSFFSLSVFILILVYFSMVSFHQQHFQNILSSTAAWDLEWLLIGRTDVNAFAIGTNGVEGILNIYGDAPINEENVMDFMNLAVEQTRSRNRDRFLWRIPAPFFEFNSHHLAFTIVYRTEDFNPDEMIHLWMLLESLEYNDNELTRDANVIISNGTDKIDPALESPLASYYVFWDATSVNKQIVILQRNFILIGFIILFAIGISTYLIAKRIVKPTEMAFEKQKQFVADASHELKTPLTMLKNNLEVLKVNEHKTIAEQKKWVENINYGLNRMTSLTTNLLKLSRLENNTNVSSYEQFDLGKTTVLIAELFEIKVNEKNISLIQDIEMGLVMNAEENLISQVITILIDNAVKYVDFGGTIELSLSSHRNLITFIVTNTGLGIPKEKLPHIFDRFYRVDESRATNESSAGLGLAIAKEIIEQNGGKIEATSTLGEKTTVSFTIKIP